MPNWNENQVTIFADTPAVKQYLICDTSTPRRWFFNMSRLFPERFSEDDPSGKIGWNYEWSCTNTGSKWFPKIDAVVAGNPTVLIYSTAWTPNEATLQVLSEKTGWRIECEYEEPGMAFEGRFIYEAGERIVGERREYRPTCDTCGIKKAASA